MSLKNKTGGHTFVCGLKNLPCYYTHMELKITELNNIKIKLSLLKAIN